MSSVYTIKKQAKILRQALAPKSEDRIIVTMWLPPDDPRHKMTDDEIIAQGMLSPNKIIILPMRGKPKDYDKDDKS